MGAFALFGSVLSLQAQAAKKKNPASKVYFAEVQGDAQIDIGDKIEDLSQKSVYTAQGMVIETKKPATEQDRTKYFSTMVYSNGTGAFFDTDTRVEVKRFVQEPFVPNRADVDVEPSISQTQAYVSRGVVGLCTSKLVAGSNMNYQTPHGSINVRGRKLVIETTPDATKISMLEGDSTVKAGAMDLGGHTLHAGQQAILRTGMAGQPNTIEINPIPRQEAPNLEEKVSMACAAKKTVYFEVRERPGDQAAGADPNAPADSAPVTAFDGDNAAAGNTTPMAQEIVPIPVVPINLPVQYVQSSSTLTTGKQ